MGESRTRGSTLRKVFVRISRSVVASVLVLAGMSGAGFLAGKTEAPDTAPLVVEAAENPPEPSRAEPADTAPAASLPAEPASDEGAPAN